MNENIKNSNLVGVFIFIKSSKNKTIKNQIHETFVKKIILSTRKRFRAFIYEGDLSPLNKND